MSHILHTHKKGQPVVNLHHNYLNCQQNPHKSKNIMNDNDHKKVYYNVNDNNNEHLPQLGFQKLVHPCCGRDMLTLQTNNNNNIKLTNMNNIRTSYTFQYDLYLLPCGHNICYLCIMQQIVPNKMCRIQCKINKCMKDYSILQAETVFIKNIGIRSFLQKLIIVKMNIQNRLRQKQQYKQRQRQKYLLQQQYQKQINKSNNSNTFLKVHYQAPQLQSYQNTKMEIDYPVDYQSSEQNNEINNYNKQNLNNINNNQYQHQCIFIFCKQLTDRLFCSDQCEDKYDQLNLADSDIEEGITVVNHSNHNGNIEYPSFRVDNYS